MIKLFKVKFIALYFILTLILLTVTEQILTFTALYAGAYSITLLITLYLFIYLKKQDFKIDQKLKIFLISSFSFSAVMWPLSLCAKYIDIQINHAAIVSFLLILICVVAFKINTFYSLILDSAAQEKKAMQAHFNGQKQQLESTLQDSQDELESKVQERTLELHIALQELEDVNRELAEKTTLDDLTGLYNRRFYDQKILAEYRRSRRNLSPLSLIVIDIDHFKKVNDTHGHLGGDECLTFIAKIMKASLHRSTDLACRYGGEEFCLIMPETTPDGAVAFAETLRNKISTSPVTFQGIEIPLTISCGVASYQQQDGATPETLFSAADQALYQAKHDGRNRVQLADPILLKRVEE